MLEVLADVDGVEEGEEVEVFGEGVEGVEMGVEGAEGGEVLGGGRKE